MLTHKSCTIIGSGKACAWLLLAEFSCAMLQWTHGQACALSSSSVLAESWAPSLVKKGGQRRRSQRPSGALCRPRMMSTDQVTSLPWMSSSKALQHMTVHIQRSLVTTLQAVSHFACVSMLKRMLCRTQWHAGAQNCKALYTCQRCAQ